MHIFILSQEELGPGDAAGASPRRFVLLFHFEGCSVSCRDRRERAGGRGTITDWTPLSLQGRRPRKLSRWRVSRARLSTLWGLRVLGFLIDWEVEGGGGRGVVTVLLRRRREEKEEVRQKR